MVKDRDNKTAEEQMCVEVRGMHGKGEQTPLFITEFLMKKNTFEV